MRFAEGKLHDILEEVAAGHNETCLAAESLAVFGEEWDAVALEEVDGVVDKFDYVGLGQLTELLGAAGLRRDFGHGAAIISNYN